MPCFLARERSRSRKEAGAVAHTLTQHRKGGSEVLCGFVATLVYTIRNRLKKQKPGRVYLKEIYRDSKTKAFKSKSMLVCCTASFIVFLGRGICPGVSWGMYVEARGQLCGGSSLLPLTYTWALRIQALSSVTYLISLLLYM